MTNANTDPTTLTIRVESAESFFKDALADLERLEPDEEVEEAADMLDKRGGAWSELADDLREDGI